MSADEKKLPGQVTGETLLRVFRCDKCKRLLCSFANTVSCRKEHRKYLMVPLPHTQAQLLVKESITA